MNKVGWIIFSAVVVALLGGLIVWARLSNPSIDVSSVNNNSIISASAQNGDIADHTKGSQDGKVLLVEYGDFQCPSCLRAHPNVNSLIEEYNDDVTLVFRNFPLTSIHPNARAAAAVAEAAGLQGKYWEMHDKLFESQNDWGNLSSSERTERFKGYAEELNLDMGKFNTDIASENVSRKISFDQALGRESKVSATPTFFLNGEQLDNATASGIVQGDMTAIKEKIDALIK